MYLWLWRHLPGGVMSKLACTIILALAAAAGSSGPPSPGGLPITGWPLALIALVGAGLLGTGGAAIVAARRRHGLRAR